MGHGPLLPLEEHGSKKIQSLYTTEFKEAVAILDFALKVIGSKPDGSGALPSISKPRGLKWAVVQLCLGIYAKSIKRFSGSCFAL